MTWIEDTQPQKTDQQILDLVSSNFNIQQINRPLIYLDSTGVQQNNLSSGVAAKVFFNRVNINTFNINPYRFDSHHFQPNQSGYYYFKTNVYLSPSIGSIQFFRYQAWFIKNNNQNFGFGSRSMTNSDQISDAAGFVYLDGLNDYVFVVAQCLGQTFDISKNIASELFVFKL